ncbi:c6 zinc finger domain protein [Fusarium austroafricanum]|uniref:C6 zinc finger domain protein n=1 Tax=Fusarium austroafricanum TaxID=2364996 RepID=A0A8H4P545_9HYPO|nr:c6 zinc finger domain protein [Fusarium austroafricanum]
MGAAAVHPLQRRVACEACRKHKARCQRFNKDDLKCARCKLLDLECTTGQQKNIGRPRRTAASAVKKPTPHMYTRTVHNDTLNLEQTMDWTSLVSPSTTPIQDTAPADIDAFGCSVAAWPTAGMDSFGQSSQPWDAFLGFADSEVMFAQDPTFGALSPPPNTTPFYLTLSPPSTPSSDHGACLTEIHSLEIPGPDKADSIDLSAALVELSKMNVDLHIRVTAADTYKADLEFDNVVQRDSPLYIDNITLAEFMLKTSLNLLQIVNRLLSNRQNVSLPAGNTISLKSRSVKSQSPQPGQPHESSCSPPVALLITSVFAQLISLYELVIGYITTRVEGISIDPIPSIPGVTFNDLPLKNSSAQGMLFCQAVVYLLERTETALGIKPESSAAQVVLPAPSLEAAVSKVKGMFETNFFGPFKSLRKYLALHYFL